MKNTGIIRKIDELGRIVIPKEIRNVLKIKSGDDLEIYIDNSTIILKRYSPIGDIKNDVDNLLVSLKDLVDCQILITDKDQIISEGPLKGEAIPKLFCDVLNERKSYRSSSVEEVFFTTQKLEGYFLVVPIIQNSSSNGLIILYKTDIIDNQDAFFLKVLKNIIENK